MKIAFISTVLKDDQVDATALVMPPEAIAALGKGRNRP
jgi:hypothetical protein